MYFASCHKNIKNIEKKIHISLLFSVQSHFSYMWMLTLEFCILSALP